MRFSLLSQGWQLKLVGSVAIVGTLLSAVGESVLAQIVPDNTLGAEGSVVTPNVNIQGIPSDQIDGGVPRGANLFHSFQEFNVGEGRGVYFANPIGIENILTRVTGGNSSNILGRLGVLGGANLFLLNPNGILFGQNASLDVQGSFFATTADGVRLGDTGLFSASEPGTSNLLAVNPSAFLFNAIAAQPIVNRSRSQSASGQPNSQGSPVGLQVPAGQALALVGGDVLLEGGNLTAAGGRIELGSVAGVGEVSLSQTGNHFVLGYDSINSFAIISLSGRAVVDASGEGGGDIQIRGARLNMAQSSVIVADTQGAVDGGEVLVRTTESVVLSEGSDLSTDVFGSGTGGQVRIETGKLIVRDGAFVSVSTESEGQAGRLTVTASEAIELIGASSDNPSGLFATAEGAGDAGDLTIDTKQLIVRDGAQVFNGTDSQGDGGTLKITASESVEVVGVSANGQFASALGTRAGGTANVGAVGTGNAGDLRIDTGRLLVRDGALVSASTFGEGKGGSLQITASDSVEVIGESADGRFGSALSTETEGSGDAGNLRIDTGYLLVRDGAQIDTGTSRGSGGKGGSLQITASDSVELTGRSADGQFPSGLFTQSNGSGDAGDLTIDTGRLLVSDGALVSAGTRSQGKGGSLQITASDSVELTGRSADERFGSRLSAQSVGSGDAGDLRIDTGRLLLRDGAEISTNISGEGLAGDINITVRDTLQANNGTIRTDSTQSRGGTITITAGDIRLFGDSDIRSNVASGADNGGNITLTTNFIVAFDDSDILAFAQDGQGGDITLKTPAFFGENYRPAPRNTNPDTLDNNDRVDINATGAVEGVITTPDTTFIQNSLTELPDNQINTESLLANSCIVRRNQPTRGTFFITGTGGLPERPGDAQMSTFPTVDIETLPSDSTPSTTNPNRPWQKGDPIVEPQGVYRLPNGKLVLSRECP